MASFNVAKLTESVTTVSAKLAKSLGNIKQFASEKMGTADEITELPETYRDLESRVEKIRILHENLIRVLRTRVIPNYDTTIGDTMQDLVSKVSSLNSFIDPTSAQLPGAPDKELVPPVYAEPEHHLAISTQQASLGFSLGDNFGIALKDFAEAQQKIGDLGLKRDAEIFSLVYKPLTTTIAQSIRTVSEARKRVSQLRLELDAAKSRIRTVTVDKMEQLDQDIVRLKEDFIREVEEASRAMNALVEDPDLTRILADFAYAQLRYHKLSLEALETNLVPALDEIHARQSGRS